jgi:EAL domain-containing protein (putative c-di-GMP-specific phosphodiesterase class I)/GGDEF domain-containing protein
MDADVVTQGQQPAGVATADVTPGRADGEPLLLAAIAAGGAAAAWTTGARSGAWNASLAVAVLAGSAWLERRRGRVPSPAGVRLARAVLSLAAAAVAVGAHSGSAPLALVWLPAVCAVYALVLPPRAAAATTLGGLAVLAVLAAGAGTAGSRPPTAYAACAVCLLAAALAAATLRAVLDARHDGARPQPEPAATPPALPTPEATVIEPLPALTESLLDAAARAQARSGVVGGRVGLLVVALRGLDELPAAVGHGAAQAALDTLARRARAWLPAGDVVAWVGGGRLAVLLEGVDAQTCLVVGRRLAALLAEPVEAGQRVLTLPASVSVTLADDVREAPRELLRRALAAPALSPSDLLPAPGSTTPDAGQDPLLDELWPALGTGAVGVALQPIVALGTLPRHDRLVAVEALARWTRADGTTVPPARFVPAARRAGLADLLGATVLAQGLDALLERRRTGTPALGLAVNVAPEQLGGPAVAAGMLQALAGRGLDPAALTVELPAAAPLHDPSAIATLQALRDEGVNVVLDNFGTTGLSIAALRDLPLTGIKLDRSLVADLGRDDRLVVATLRLATRLGLACTAVGVETPEQLEAARSLGVDGAQGHLLGRPESAAAPAAQPGGTASGVPAAGAADILSRA